MATPKLKLRRIGATIGLFMAAAVSSGCAARAEYVYDEPVVYREDRVYGPPPVVVYREHHHDHYAPSPRRAPAYRGRVGVYRAPVHVHRPPPARHHDHHDRGRDSRREHDHHDRDRDSRREHDHGRHHR